MSYGEIDFRGLQQFALDLRQKQHDQFVEEIQRHRDTDISVLEAFQAEANKFIDEICDPPSNTRLPRLLRSSSYQLPEFNSVLSIPNPVNPNLIDPSPSNTQDDEADVDADSIESDVDSHAHNHYSNGDDIRLEHHEETPRPHPHSNAPSNSTRNESSATKGVTGTEIPSTPIASAADKSLLETRRKSSTSTGSVEFRTPPSIQKDEQGKDEDVFERKVNTRHHNDNLEITKNSKLATAREQNSDGSRSHRKVVDSIEISPVPLITSRLSADSDLAIVTTQNSSGTAPTPEVLVNRKMKEGRESIDESNDVISYSNSEDVVDQKEYDPSMDKLMKGDHSDSESESSDGGDNPSMDNHREVDRSDSESESSDAGEVIDSKEAELLVNDWNKELSSMRIPSDSISRHRELCIAVERDREEIAKRRREVEEEEEEIEKREKLKGKPTEKDFGSKNDVVELSNKNLYNKSLSTYDVNAEDQDSESDIVMQTDGGEEEKDADSPFVSPAIFKGKNSKLGKNQSTQSPIPKASLHFDSYESNESSEDEAVVEEEESREIDVQMHDGSEDDEDDRKELNLSHIAPEGIEDSSGDETPIVKHRNKQTNKRSSAIRKKSEEKPIQILSESESESVKSVLPPQKPEEGLVRKLEKAIEDEDCTDEDGNDSVNDILPEENKSNTQFKADNAENNKPIQVCTESDQCNPVLLDDEDGSDSEISRSKARSPEWKANPFQRAGSRDKITQMPKASPSSSHIAARHCSFGSISVDVSNLPIETTNRSRKKSVSFMEQKDDLLSNQKDTKNRANAYLDTDSSDEEDKVSDENVNPIVVGSDSKLDPTAIRKLMSGASPASRATKTPKTLKPAGILRTTRKPTDNGTDSKKTMNYASTQRIGRYPTFGGTGSKVYSSSRSSLLSHTPGAKPPLPPSARKQTTSDGMHGSSPHLTSAIRKDLTSSTLNGFDQGSYSKQSANLTQESSDIDEDDKEVDDDDHKVQTPPFSPYVPSSCIAESLEETNKAGEHGVRSQDQASAATEKFKRELMASKKVSIVDNLHQTEVISRRPILLLDSARPKSEARRRIESIRASRKTKQTENGSLSSDPTEAMEFGEKRTFSTSVSGTTPSTLSSDRVLPRTDDEIDDSDAGDEHEGDKISEVPKVDTKPTTKPSNALSSMPSNLMSSSMAQQHQPSNLLADGSGMGLMNLMTSVTSFLPSASSLLGFGNGIADSSMVESEGENAEAIVRRQKEDAERRDEERRARIEATRQQKQRENEEKMKRAEMKRRKLAKEERAKEEERRRREMKRNQKKREEEEEYRRKKVEEDRLREVKRKNVLNLKRKMEQEKEMELKRQRKEKAVFHNSAVAGSVKSTTSHQDTRSYSVDFSPDSGRGAGAGGGVMATPTSLGRKRRGKESLGPSNYMMTPANETILEASDEETDRRKGKPVPNWAKEEKLMNSLREQTDPDQLFGSSSGCNLSDVFGQQRKYRTRSSSGNWLSDRLTAQEELAYKKVTRGFDE